MNLQDIQDGNRPLVLDLDFDPGWHGIRHQFEAKALNRPKYVQRVFNQDPHWLKASSTNHLLRLASSIKVLDEAALDFRTYVHFQGDIRPYRSFSLEHDDKKIVLLKNSFHAQARKRSKLSLKEKSEFLDSLKGERRASAFPRLLYFMPSQNTREDERKGLPLLFDRSVNCGTGPLDCSGDFVISPVIKAHNKDTRATIMNHHQVAVIGVPRIDLETFSEDEASILQDSDTDTRFGRIVFGVVNPKQVAVRIPDNLL